MSSQSDTDKEELPEAIIYPHQAIAYISIAKMWAITGAAIGGVVFGRQHLAENLQTPATALIAFLILASLLFAAQRLLHYSHTYLSITKNALIYRKGWIPSNTDNVFWINIKDINTSSSVTESLLKTGSIVIIVAIRNTIYQIQVSYLPKHEDIASKIRAHVGVLNQDARQITYT
jgi:membrane protein YdbS with pleckstrin-like domain